MKIPMSLVRVGLMTSLLLLASCGGGDGGSKTDPKIRLLNLSAGYSSLDMMTNLDSDDDDDDETQAESVALETVSDFVSLDPDDYTIKLRRSGSGSVLRSFSGEELVEETVNTYVAYGEVGQFGALRIDESLDPADAGENILHVANVSSAGSLDLYLTDATTDLDDTTPVLSSVGTSLVRVTSDSGTYRLRVTAAGDTSDVRLDVADFELADKGVGSLILTSTQGGMLTHGIYLPQQGQPVKFANTKARVRGAVALANGAAATIQLNGRTLLTSATAGVISSRYSTVDSGTLPVTLAVNGTPVTVPNVTLLAGADYTLMVWGSADAPEVSLINDDNRLPSGGSGMTKLRLLNGMSTLASPITLSVDFSPVIEGVPVGQVSDKEELSSGSDRQFDVSNTSTAALVLSRPSITLQSNSVYTFFMTDNGATPIGVLRKDR